MPRVLVVTDNGRTVVDELVNPEQLDNEHSAVELIERLAWGLEDAVRAEARFRDAIESALPTRPAIVDAEQPPKSRPRGEHDRAFRS
jgi:hypothetical protein